MVWDHEDIRVQSEGNWRRLEPPQTATFCSLPIRQATPEREREYMVQANRILYVLSYERAQIKNIILIAGEIGCHRPQL